jgi:dTDP-4-dehydrorhamnose reductase
VTHPGPLDKDAPGRGPVSRLADWFGLDEGARQRLAVAEGDLLDPGWAVAALSGGNGLGRIDEIVHCASNTAFAERKRPEIEAANIGGLRNVLELAARSACSFFHHVSTAYVAGMRTGPCPEDWVESGPFTNVYEETKARGEILARDICRREGIRLSVYRPSIVYGDSRTGRTLRFNALYYPVKAAVLLRDIYASDIRERGGAKAAAMGVRIDPDGRVHLPIRIEVGPRAASTWSPSTTVSKPSWPSGKSALTAASSTSPTPARRGSRTSSDMPSDFSASGASRPAGRRPSRPAPRTPWKGSTTPISRPIARTCRTCGPSSPAIPGLVLEKRGLVCPEFDEDMFRRCMSFAVEAGWGARLFPA